MLTARNSDELMESMRDWVDPCNNFLFADIHGNIGYQCRGEIPVRSKQNARLPVPGWTGKHEWQGQIPFEELPRSVNPTQGYIATANNKPVGDDYPHFIAVDFAPGFRGERVTRGLLALAWIRHGITVNAIGPGPTETPGLLAPTRACRMTWPRTCRLTCPWAGG